MRRSIPSLLILAGSLLASASAQVMVTPEGWATTSGPAIGVYAPVLVTPEAHLDTPQQAIGATAASPGQQLGATSSPASRVLTPTAPSIVPRVINAPPLVYAIAPQPEDAAQTPASASGTQTMASPVNLGIAPVGGSGLLCRQSQSCPAGGGGARQFAEAGGSHPHQSGCAAPERADQVWHPRLARAESCNSRAIG